MDAPGVAARQAAHVLDRGVVAAECRRIAPQNACDPQRWDRTMLLAAALLSSPDIAAARSEVASATAAARAARAPAGPTLSLTSEYAGATSDPSPWLFGAGLTVPLDTGGVRRTRLASADLGPIVARYGLIDTIWSVRMTMARSLAHYMVAQRQETAATVLLATQERRKAAMTNRVVAGEAARGELERIVGDVADAARRRDEARARTASAITALGLPAGALDGVELVWEDFDTPPGISTGTPAQHQAAATARTDVLRVVVAYDQAEIDLRGEVSRQYPSITLGPGFTWERGLVKLPFALGLALPPLDLNRSAIAAAEARRVEAGHRLEAAVLAATGAIDTALIECAASRTALNRLRTVDLPAARSLAQRAERDLRAGAIDRTEWAVSQAGEQLARLAEIDALARVHAADAALEEAYRRPLAGPETAIASIGQ
jgi:outer membrane protein, heavy metal efflux system